MMRLLRLWRLAATDLRLLWFAARHPNRPLWLLPALALVVFYAVDPLNVAVPLLGIIDEFVLVPLALTTMARLLPLEIRARFAAR